MEYCNAQEAKLANLLKSWCRGPKNSRSADKLAAGVQTSERQLRAMIRHLRMAHNLPICSTPADSFFYPQERYQANHTLETFSSRIEALGETKKAIEEGLEDVFGAPNLFDTLKEKRVI